MVIKIIFFDVDGTLKSFNNKGITEAVLQALQALKEKGIKIFLATGRAPYAVPKFEGISFDGYVCFNGAYCYAGKDIIFSKPLDKKDVQQLFRNAKELNEPLVAAGKSEMNVSGYNKVLEEYLGVANVKYPATDLDYFKKFIEGDIYQFMVSGGPEKDNHYLKDCKHLKVARWWQHAFDVVADDCSKSMAIQKVLEFYNIKREESMAFGDGGNDEDMIEYVGVGVAMGDATDSVKKVADYITDTVDDDGVVTALKHFKIL